MLLTSLNKSQASKLSGRAPPIGGGVRGSNPLLFTIGPLYSSKLDSVGRVW